MSVPRAREALTRMRELVDSGSIDDLHDASAYALIYLAEHTASEVGKRWRAARDISDAPLANPPLATSGIDDPDESLGETSTRS